MARRRRIYYLSARASSLSASSRKLKANGWLLELAFTVGWLILIILNPLVEHLFTSLIEHEAHQFVYVLVLLSRCFEVLDVVLLHQL